MKLKEVEAKAVALPERDRADLVRALLDTLPPQGTEVSDDEVAQRDRESESGAVKDMTHEEFVRRVQKERRR